MNLVQLEAFVETCRGGSYTRAAERLYVSQPALDHKVKQLEVELGVPLLITHERRMIPTADGELVLAIGERVLHEVRGLKEHFKQLAGQQAVQVGATTLLAAAVLPPAIASFRAARPHVRVHMIALDRNERYDALLAGRVDFAVISSPFVTDDIETEPLLEWEDICGGGSTRAGRSVIPRRCGCERATGGVRGADGRAAGPGGGVIA